MSHPIARSLAWAPLILGVVPELGSAADEAERASKTAVVACAANIDSFTQYQCRYTITQADAATFADAKAGHFSKAGRTVTHHRLAVDGQRVYYECSAPSVDEITGRQENIAEVKRKGIAHINVPAVSYGYLTNGKRALGHSPDLSAINLFDEQYSGNPPRQTPLGYCGARFQEARTSPDGLLARPDQFEAEFHGVAEFEGRPVISVQFNRRDHSEKKRFDLDPGMGYLPVYQVRDFPDRKAPDGGGSDRVFIEAARKCKADRWFPERIRLVRWYGTKYQVYLLEVTELDVDHRPADKEFTLRVPVGTAVCGDRDPKKHFRMKQDEAIGLDDIDRVFELWEKADGVTPMDTGLTAPGRRHWWWWIGGGLVGVGTLAFYRRARRRPEQR